MRSDGTIAGPRWQASAAARVAGRTRSFGRARARALAFALVVGLFVAGLARPSLAQEARVEIAREPYYQGQPIELHVVAEQFEEDPTPEVEFEPPPGASIELLGVSPSSSTSITIVNGQISRVHQVSFTFRYALSTSRVGALRIPTFRVRQGSVVRTTRPFEIEVAAVPSSDEFAIAVVLPQGPIVVGQKVPVAIEFRIDQAAADQILDYRIQVPLFDVPGLRFIDSAPAGADTQLQIMTDAGPLQLPAKSEQRDVAGRPSLVLRAERTLVAQRPGRIEAGPPTVAVERGTRFRQDLFGGRRAVQTQRTVSAGRAVRVEVAELPTEGRPPSFAGAVGSDFSFEVEADRSVVQLGEPIELELHVRGRGDLSAAGLPALDAPGLFDPKRFRLPEEAPAGLIDGDGKHFRVTLRVLDASVREIPALAYSFFDSETRRFETVHSQPIALSVSAARIVGADAVTSAAPDAQGGAGDASAAAQARAAAEAEAQSAQGAPGGGDASAVAGAGGGVRASSLAESAANLALERDPDRLLRGVRQTQGTDLATLSLYLVGLALVAVGFVDRRRRTIDPKQRARLEALARARAAVEAALRSGTDGPGALGRALREWIAERPEEASPEVDVLLAECDALRFAPGAGGAAGGGAGGVPESLAARARQLMETRQASASGSAAASGAKGGAGTAARIARLLLLGLVPGLVGLVGLVGLAAGAPPAAAAENDARARIERAVADYEAAQAEADLEARIAGFQRAERGFAALVEEGARSPELYTNLGNAALQAGRVGPAVLAYRRALRLDPESATARQNLAHVRSRLPGWVPRPGSEGTGDGLSLPLQVPRPVRALAAAGCFALAALALVVAGRRREGPWRGLAIALGLAWLGLLGSVVAEARGMEGRAAVLTAEETPARSSDSALAALAFPDPLPEGVEVERLEQRGDFARIRLANGRDVWVRSSSLSLIDD